MKIKFVSEGGFAGISRQHNDNSDNLPENLSNVLKMMVEQKEKYKNIISNPKARDAMNYYLELETGSEKINFHFDDTSLPSEIEPLISHLNKKSKPLQI